MTAASAAAGALIELRAGALRLALAPDLGGAIAGWWCDDHPVLRAPPAEGLTSARQAACYPLLPYSGRLGYRRFRWLGAEHTTRANVDDSPHSLHGLAWQRPWRVDAAGETAARLVLEHAGDSDWPFPFSAEQRFELGDGTLRCTLAVTGGGASPQPMGLGWHPYFPKRQRSRLHAETSARWDTDATGLPTRRVPHAGIDGDVAHMAFDHCFEGSGGQARIRDERFALRIASSLPYLVVYTPPLREHYCVEPVSHVANAIHLSDPLAHGLVALAPRETLQAWMTIDVTRVR